MGEVSETVFVYGTLRRGGSNAFRMAGAEHLGAGHVRGRLHAITWYPGLVLDAAGDAVTGDVFLVPPDQLPALDEFEGISAGEIEGAEYRRVRTSVTMSGGEAIGAWIYEWTGPVDDSRRIASGDWLDEIAATG